MLQGRKLNILVAEDDADDFYFLRRLLAKAGIGSVLHVTDGERATHYLAGEGEFSNREQYPIPDVFLLDLKLPRRSGKEILTWLQKQRHLAKVKTFVLSGTISDLDQSDAEAAGAAGCFLKPISLGHVAEIWRHVAQADRSGGAREPAETAAERKASLMLPLLARWDLP